MGLATGSQRAGLISPTIAMSALCAGCCGYGVTATGKTQNAEVILPIGRTRGMTRPERLSPVNTSPPSRSEIEEGSGTGVTEPEAMDRVELPSVNLL